MKENHTLGFTFYVLGLAVAVVSLLGIIPLPFVILTVGFALLGNLFLPFEKLPKELSSWGNKSQATQQQQPLQTSRG